MSDYTAIQSELRAAPKQWLITGVAGFIGSHLLETLLGLGQPVIGLDNFATGKRRNLDEVRGRVGPERWRQFQFLEADILDLAACRRACEGVELVLHQAALGSVPRSIEDPLNFHTCNVTGFLNVLLAARDAGARRLVYASSSAVYGDEPGLPKAEEKIGRPLSPYAASKWMNEIYAGVAELAYGTAAVGLRYFNVFGPRQDPNGAYAAVIPKWINSLLNREPIYINGDGETSRDFCHVDDVVQANLLAATATHPEAVNQVYNVASGELTTLNQLFAILADLVRRHQPDLPAPAPVYRDFRAGDVRHSLANIGKAQRLLGYQPTRQVRQGLEAAFDWYQRQQPV